jgi:hypothetical protein
MVGGSSGPGLTACVGGDALAKAGAVVAAVAVIIPGWDFGDALWSS